MSGRRVSADYCPFGSGCPVADGDEGGPVVGVLARRVRHHRLLRCAQRRRATFAFEQALVVVHHQLLGGRIGHLPQRGELRLRPREHQCSTQTIDALARLHLPHPGLAGREHHQLRATQIELRGFGRGEDAVIAFARVTALRRSA